MWTRIATEDPGTVLGFRADPDDEGYASAAVMGVRATAGFADGAALDRNAIVAAAPALSETEAGVSRAPSGGLR